MLPHVRRAAGPALGGSETESGVHSVSPPPPNPVLTEFGPGKLRRTRKEGRAKLKMFEFKSHLY